MNPGQRLAVDSIMLGIQRLSRPSISGLLERERVRLHLRLAETRLRAVNVGNLSARRSHAHEQRLSLLRAYWKHGVFPHNDAQPGNRLSPHPPDVLNPFGEWDVLVGFVAASIGLSHLLTRRRSEQS